MLESPSFPLFSSGRPLCDCIMAFLHHMNEASKKTWHSQITGEVCRKQPSLQPNSSFQKQRHKLKWRSELEVSTKIRENMHKRSFRKDAWRQRQQSLRQCNSLALKVFASSSSFLNVLVLVVAMDTTSSFNFFHASCFAPATGVLHMGLPEGEELNISQGKIFHTSLQPQELKVWIRPFPTTPTALKILNL